MVRGKGWANNSVNEKSVWQLRKLVHLPVDVIYLSLPFSINLSFKYRNKTFKNPAVAARLLEFRGRAEDIHVCNSFGLSLGSSCHVAGVSQGFNHEQNRLRCAVGNAVCSSWGENKEQHAMYMEKPSAPACSALLPRRGKTGYGTQDSCALSPNLLPGDQVHRTDNTGVLCYNEDSSFHNWATPLGRRKRNGRDDGPPGLPGSVSIPSIKGKTFCISPH